MFDSTQTHVSQLLHSKIWFTHVPIVACQQSLGVDLRTYSKSSFHHKKFEMSHITVAAVILTKISLKTENVYLNDILKRSWFLPGIHNISEPDGL